MTTITQALSSAPKPPSLESLESPATAPSGDFLEALIANIDDEMETLYGADLLAEGVDVPDQRSTSSAASAPSQYVRFALGETEYAIPIYNLVEIGRPLPITAVPNVPPWILGVANLRGDIISVISLHIFWQQTTPFNPQTSRMLVVKAQQDELITALLVDRVQGLGVWSASDIHPPKAALDDEVAPYLQGVYQKEGRLTAVLNLDQFLHSAALQQFQPT